jgi:catechol 1,2-dioxygenase
MPIFDDVSPYLADDSVFAVKNSLLASFKPIEDDPQATLEVEYDYFKHKM